MVGLTFSSPMDGPSPRGAPPGAPPGALSESSPFALATNIVWGVGCAIALVALLWPLPKACNNEGGLSPSRWRCTCSHRPRLRSLLACYLVAHIAATLAALLAHLSEARAAAAATASQLLSLLAAATYCEIGTILVLPRSDAAWRVALVGAALAYVAGAVTIAVLSSDEATRPSAVLVLFGLYLLAALWASMGVVLLARRHARTAWQVRVFIVSALVGMVDFLLPAIAYLGAPIWQPGFLGRALDVALYLPGAVIAFRWMETRSEYGLLAAGSRHSIDHAQALAPPPTCSPL